jgi:ferric-dicitrate binding protein FerR (iron transport regulator)
MDNSFKEFVTGKNKESVEAWTNWINENPSARNEFEIAIKVMHLLLKTKKDISDLHTEEDLKELLAKIHSENDNEILTESSNTRFQWYRIAAIFVLLFTLSATFYFLFKNRSKGGEDLVYNEIIVPLGEKSQLILADGTHIWINSSSKLRYPVNFSKKNRTVYLEGEAYFDVTKKEGQPFIVSTPDLNVKVLGTAFNVKNYPGDKKAVTTVVRGLVSVESKKELTKPVLLKPNENIVLSTIAEPEDKAVKHENVREEQATPTMEAIINKTVNVEAITSWKDQMLVFSDEPLEEVALKMERWYNVKVFIRNEGLKKERYRGKFVNNETIYQVLEVINYTTPIKYSMKNNEIYIDKRN